MNSLKQSLITEAVRRYKREFSEIHDYPLLEELISDIVAHTVDKTVQACIKKVPKHCFGCNDKRCTGIHANEYLGYEDSLEDSHV